MKTNHLRNYIAIAVVILLSSGCRGCPKSVTAPFAIVYFGKK